MQVKKNAYVTNVMHSREKRPTPSYRHGLVGIPNQIAGDSFYYLNYPFPGCESYFNDELLGLRYSDRYYPHALGGPLWVDIKSHDSDSRDFEIKKKIMKKLNLRYLVITKTMNLIDCYEALA